MHKSDAGRLMLPAVIQVSYRQVEVGEGCKY